MRARSSRSMEVRRVSVGAWRSESPVRSFDRHGRPTIFLAWSDPRVSVPPRGCSLATSSIVMSGRERVSLRP